MEVESCGVDMEEDTEPNGFDSNGIEVIDVFQIQLQRNDQEQIRQKILSEEDPTYVQADDIMGEDQSQYSTGQNEINTESNKFESAANNNNSGINLSFKYAKIEQQYSSNFQSYPAIVSVDTHSQQGGQQQRRVPIDLVCVVDNSASMSTENKMKLIRKSLRYLLKILNDKDRISIITFSTHSKIRTGFLRNSIENKQKLKSIIKKLNTASTTNIAEGIDNCMWLLKNRKYKNPITSVFLLSDGKDDHPGVIERVDDIMTKYKMEDVDFEMTTFGYGSDHDPLELNGISQLRNGNFFYITELKRISEYFILALSALLNAVVENASISFQLRSFTINKVYGAENVWKKNMLTNKYEIIQPHLIEGDLKQYVCEINRDFTYQNENPNENLFENYAILSGKLLYSQSNINPNHQHQNQQISSVLLEECSSEEDIRDICINHLRAKGAEAISEARIRANIERFEKAQEILNNFIADLNNSPYSQDYMLNSLKEDLEKALTLCQKQEFQAEGQAFMIKKERTLLKRTGSISSGLGWTEGQQEIMQDYKEGKLALSDDSCPSRFGDDKIEQDFSGLNVPENQFQDENIEYGRQIDNPQYADSDDDNFEQQEYEEFNEKVREKISLEKQKQIKQTKFSENDQMKDEQSEEINRKIEDNNQEYDDDEENNEREDNENDNKGEEDEEEEEEEEEIVLSSLAQKLMNKNGNIDKVLKKNI